MKKIRTIDVLNGSREVADKLSNKVEGAVMKLFWLGTVICAVIGFLTLLITVLTAQSAPQQAAGAALAAAWAVVPYVFCRALQEMKK